jgi:hypothetical protein
LKTSARINQQIAEAIRQAATREAKKFISAITDLKILSTALYLARRITRCC